MTCVTFQIFQKTTIFSTKWYNWKIYLLTVSKWRPKELILSLKRLFSSSFPIPIEFYLFVCFILAISHGTYLNIFILASISRHNLWLPSVLLVEYPISNLFSRFTWQIKDNCFLSRFTYLFFECHFTQTNLQYQKTILLKEF